MKKLSKSLIALCVITAVLFSSIVTFSAASPKLSKTKKTLIVGKSFTLTLKNATKKFTWTTSNKNVAKLVSVKKNSVKIKGVKAGTATVTAKIGSKKLKCKITVKDKTQPVDESAPTEQPTAKEYKVLSFYKGTAQYIENSINAYANEGWVVNSITSYVIYQDRVYVYVILERDKVE